MILKQGVASATNVTNTTQTTTDLFEVPEGKYIYIPPQAGVDLSYTSPVDDTPSVSSLVRMPVYDPGLPASSSFVSTDLSQHNVGSWSPVSVNIISPGFYMPSGFKIVPRADGNNAGFIRTYKFMYFEFDNE